jgi:hypothetical protein
MGTAENPEIVLPIVGILSRLPPPAELESLRAGILGPPALHSPVWDFGATRYYEPEMGTDLKRWFPAFEPNHPGRLPRWKAATNKMEQRGLNPSGRRVNLDPGYLTLGGLFLASTKPGVHRPDVVEYGEGKHAYNAGVARVDAVARSCQASQRAGKDRSCVMQLSLSPY